MVEPDKESLAAFSVALREAMAAREVNSAELARRIGRSASAVSNYTIGRDAPAPAIVFAIEDALEVAGGYLSRILGYCPCEPDGPAGVEEAVLADRNLATEQRKMLLGIYRSFIGPGPAVQG